MGEIEIRPYDGGCKAEMLSDIAAFWAAHYLTVTPEDQEEALQALALIPICGCRRSYACRSRGAPEH